MATTKRKSRILEEMHETVRGLHKIGLIDKRRMDESDLLALVSVRVKEAVEDTRKTRLRLDNTLKALNGEEA